MSLYHPQNIEELIQAAKIHLGEGVIQINTSEQQDVLAAKKAISMYTDYHYDATERVFISQEITAADMENNYINTAPNVHNVTRVLGVNKIPNLFGRGVGHGGGSNGTSYSTHAFGSSSGISGGGAVAAAQALTTYYLSEAHRTFFNSIIFPNIGIDWNAGSKRIRFLGNIRQVLGCSKSAVVYEARVVNENLQFDCEQPEGEGSCFYDNEWLIEYTAAQIQKMWGQNLSKFSNINIASGFDFNGEQILQGAQENIEKLEEQLFSRYTLPAMMIIG